MTTKQPQEPIGIKPDPPPNAPYPNLDCSNKYLLLKNDIDILSERVKRIELAIEANVINNSNLRKVDE